MVPSTPSPSARLLRAAAAEREDLARHRDRLVIAREQLTEELARIDASLHELDERSRLLDRLAGPESTARPGEQPTAVDHAPGPAAPRLRGPAIRRAAVEALLARPERPEALHYRDWYAALRDAGFEVAGKDPLAVFLTQISRSPVIRKSTQPGVYELDTRAAHRLRDRLDRLHEDLRALSATPSAATDLAAVRSRRAQIHAEIGQVEKALVEAEELLGGGHRSPLAAAG
ncbi:MAG TPA: hypothetical protein VGO81_14100 [Solirubrobacteraceae bacterium]|jgi:hypothetical protein|nr:hypothetical protein [Solirubrobacteraceae bacterium]